MPSLEGISLPDSDLVYNIVCGDCTAALLLGSIEAIRTVRCGFEFRMPKINICILGI